MFIYWLQDNKKLLINITVIITLIIFIPTLILYILDLNFMIVSGESMSPTIKDNSIVLYNKRYKDIEENDIILFYDKTDIINVKRVVGIPNDEVRVKYNKIYKNGTLLDYDYSKVKDMSYSISDSVVYVSLGEYYVVGDNFTQSIDSRNYGTIKENKIIGKVKFSFKFW